MSIVTLLQDYNLQECVLDRCPQPISPYHHPLSHFWLVVHFEWACAGVVGDVGQQEMMHGSGLCTVFRAHRTARAISFHSADSSV